MTAQGTAIGWTHAPGFKGETWNPTTGCDRVSPECARCYARELAPKLRRWAQARGQTTGWAAAEDGAPASGPAFKLMLHPERLDQPRRWRAPRMVFVDSMSDLFHEDVPAAFLDQVWQVMADAPQHRFLILTKRADRMREYVQQRHEPAACGYLGDDPLPNVWLGVTIGNRRYVHRADDLRATPAAVRFISAEPLLGPLLYDRWTGDPVISNPVGSWHDGHDGPELNLDGIDWVICGGESGKGFRPFPLRHARALRDRCAEQGVAFFLKQIGGRTPTAGGRELDGREHSEWPQDPATSVSD